MERLRSEDLLNDVAPNFDVYGTLFKELFQNVEVEESSSRMNNFGRSMNESDFDLVLFKPSTHLFQWSEIRLGLLLRLP